MAKSNMAAIFPILPLNSQKPLFFHFLHHFYDGFCLLDLDLSLKCVFLQRNVEQKAQKPVFLPVLVMTYFMHCWIECWYFLSIKPYFIPDCTQYCLILHTFWQINLEWTSDRRGPVFFFVSADWCTIAMLNARLLYICTIVLSFARLQHKIQ